MTTANELRQAFLGYFESHGHSIVPSSPLVPHNDPTLMFTNSGMVQFKNIFTGAETPPNPPRATTAQKCVRAGGKHNDLDNVGYTARHHTFFEMMGNFSFGDYFKEKAIHHAWTLLTKELKLPKDKLMVTVYHTDDEAFDLWKKIAGLHDDKIIRIPTSDNFWQMGDTGPCGPCSEIFYDHGAKIAGGPPGSADADGDRFIEVWNLVFMQFEQFGEGKRQPLPKPCVDTGMGLERMAAVMQGVHDNYDIDLFHKLMAASVELTGKKAVGEQASSHKVIADHLRSSCFLMADGVLPSNEGRGYVLRRIMRRAMRHAHILGCKDPLMYRLVPALVAEMGNAYPELKRAEAMITENLKLEEQRFRITLDRGLKLLEEERTKINKGGALSGEAAFKLYDTYGFPLDLTQDILRGYGQTVDTEGFAVAMGQQKARARAAWAGSGDTSVSTLWFDLKEKLGATEFLGYTQDMAQATILAIVKDGAEVRSAKAGDTVQLLVNQTPFYAESGGQAGDTGTLYRDEDHFAQVTNTLKPLPDLHVHVVEVKRGELKTGDDITLSIDADRRARIRANHSATHILHAVLKRFLGEHIAQKGSLVTDERLRFDISHPKAVSREELDTIEREVNRVIWQNSDVSTKLMSPDEAITEGATALFGEKYGDEVRVLSMGLDEDGKRSYSVELCGGTHVKRVGDIGVFRIVTESSISAGVRRIEAVTQMGAYEYLAQQDNALKNLALDLKIKPEELSNKITALQDDRKKLEKELAETKKKLAMGGAGGGGAMEAETVGAYQFIGKTFEDLDPKALRDLATELAQKNTNTVVALASGFDGKASIVVALAKDVAGKLDAPTLVRTAVEAVGGKGGGGRPDIAQAGGPDAANIGASIDAIKKAVA